MIRSLQCLLKWLPVLLSYCACESCLGFSIISSTIKLKEVRSPLLLSSQYEPQDGQQTQRKDEKQQFKEEWEIPTPHSGLKPEEIVPICMIGLQQNDSPFKNAGLEINFSFASDRCRAAIGSSLENFIVYADNPIFGKMVDMKGFKILKAGPIIPGTNTRGDMQTYLTSIIPSGNLLNTAGSNNMNSGGVSGDNNNTEGGREMKFLWTLQKERRPPRQNFWLIHEVIFVDNAFALTE